MSAQARVMAFAKEQPSAVWVLQFGMLVNFFGNGLVAPFLILYLHFARGLPIGVAGAAIATGGITAIASGFLAGWSADRFGPKFTVAAAMLANALAYALYLRVTEPWQAFGVAALVGVGTGAYGPSQQSLVATLVRAEQRHRVFTQNRMFALLGLGLGGIVGGFIAAGGRASDYETLLVLDVVTFVVFAVVLARIPVAGRRSKRTSSDGYRSALRDRSLVRLCVVNLALVSAGIAPMLVLMPAYAKVHGGVGESAIGLAYAANTFTVLVAQIPTTRFSEGRRRMPLLALGTSLWIVAWAVLLAAAIGLEAWAGVLVAAAVVIYGVGECLYSAIVVPTVAAIAPDALRGRYLAVMGFSWQGGFMIGPAFGATLIAMGPLGLPVIATALCLAAIIGALALERGLPPEHVRTPRAISAGASSSALVRWITREHPRVDRVACPWLIQRFIDKDAEFIYVATDEVMTEAKRQDATPYDVKDVELGHHGAECSFDAFVRKYRLDADPAMAYMAKVIRGADTSDKMLTPESVGIEALLEGVRLVHTPNDQKQREASRPILDALYSYCQAKVAA